MDLPMFNVSSYTCQNIEIKAEKFEILEIDEQIFTNDDSQELQNVSYSQNINGVDDQVFINEEIICKEEPEFYDAANARTIPESQMMLTATESEERQIDSTVSKIDDKNTSSPSPSSSSSSLPSSNLKSSKCQSTTSPSSALPITRTNKVQPRIFECYICQHAKPTIHSLRSHFTQHIGDIVYKCSHCSATFKRMWHFSRHISQEHSKNGEKYTCTYCYRTFSTKTRLANHQRIHTGQQPFCCSVCQKRFNTRSSFNLHTKIHTGEKQYKCTECSMRFRLKHHLDSHLRAHTKQSKLCRQLSSNKANMNKSKAIQQGWLSLDPAIGDELSVDVRTYQCYLCGFNANRNQLKVHMKTDHTGGKLFNCKLCSKIFLKHYSIELHMLTHSKSCPFKCDICGKEFRRKDGLKMHMQAVHSKQTVFQCTVCMENFYKKFTFVTHMRRHTGFKPFTCAFCSKAFVKRSDMVRHSRTHTGERPHQCDMCKMTFTRNHLLSDHKRNIHGV